jgi:hypothetical protein
MVKKRFPKRRPSRCAETKTPKECGLGPSRCMVLRKQIFRYLALIDDRFIGEGQRTH